MIWTIHDELNALLKKKVVDDYKRKMHDMVLMGYLRQMIEHEIWPKNMENAPYCRLMIRGSFRRPWLASGNLMEVMLDKTIVVVAHRNIPIWTYCGAFVHVACKEDWMLLADEVLGQLIDEEFEEFASRQDEAEVRAAHYMRNNHGYY